MHHSVKATYPELTSVHRDEERVTIIFRGTIGQGKDWENNFKMMLVPIDTPKRLKSAGFDKDIRVHHGFKSESASRWLIVLTVWECTVY